MISHDEAVRHCSNLFTGDESAKDTEPLQEYIAQQRTRDAALRAAGLVDENGEVLTHDHVRFAEVVLACWRLKEECGFPSLCDPRRAESVKGLVIDYARGELTREAALSARSTKEADRGA